MNTPLAQFIVLATYGNEFLKGKIEIPLSFSNTNSTFQFCSQIIFSTTNQETISGSPEEWFLYLKQKGCKALKLYYQSSENKKDDPMLAGFVGGGGVWLLEAIYENYSDYWSGHWEYEKANQKKPWKVTYQLSYPEKQTYNIQMNPQVIKNKLQESLLQISEFAYRIYGPDSMWGKRFDLSLSMLESSEPWQTYYHKDLIPLSNFSLLKKQILFSAANSFVFGGMGSWNDTYFENKEEQDEYTQLSGQLYSSIMNTILSAVNYE